MKPGRSLVRLLLLLICLSQPAWGAGGAEVRRLGLSRVEENTLLTVVLDQAAEPRVTTRTTAGKPQLVVEFPQARAARLPSRLEGDDLLVEQVMTEISPSGVRLILNLFPERPYTYWRQKRPGTAGQTIFILGLKPEGTPRPRSQMARSPEPPSPGLPPVPRESYRERELEPVPSPEPPGEEGGYQPPRGSETPGSFAEVRRLLPKASNLLQGLQADGWTVSETHQYDRPGQRFSRDFLLANGKYPQLVVKIAYLAANTPNTPNIAFITLSTERIGGEAAAKYQNLRQWTFAKIRQSYEDIGDFFDDALKPLRVKLREETKALALRDAAVFQSFLKRACPQNPQLVEKVMSHMREKVNPRFEGVQYTVSEDPLVILNMVDFLYLKVYYVDYPR